MRDPTELGSIWGRPSVLLDAKGRVSRTLSPAEFLNGKAQAGRIIVVGYDEDRSPVDKEIIGYLRMMNANPNLYTAGSCFGHGTDTPFLVVEFRDPSVTAHYISLLKKAGIAVEDKWPPNGWGVTLPGSNRHRQYSKAQSHQFFRTVTAILTGRPFGSIPKGPDFTAKPSKVVDQGSTDTYQWKLAFRNDDTGRLPWQFWYKERGRKAWSIAEGRSKEEAKAMAVRFMAAAERMKLKGLHWNG